MKEYDIEELIVWWGVVEGGGWTTTHGNCDEITDSQYIALSAAYGSPVYKAELDL